jgi:hypothetical protein
MQCFSVTHGVCCVRLNALRLVGIGEAQLLLAIFLVIVVQIIYYMKSTVFWVETLSSSEKGRCFAEKYRLHIQGQKLSQASTSRSRRKSEPLHRNEAQLSACFMLVSCLACSSTLKMAAICSWQTPVEFHRTTRRYNPQYRAFRSTAVRASKPDNIPVSWQASWLLSPHQANA